MTPGMGVDSVAPDRALPAWWHLDARDGTLTLDLHIQPGASRTEIAGEHGDRLKLRVSAPPVDGAANRAVVEFVAARLDVARAAVSVVRGTTSRAKTVAVADAAALSPDVLLAGR